VRLPQVVAKVELPPVQAALPLARLPQGVAQEEQVLSLGAFSLLRPALHRRVQ
jgi:hypothetical protein